MSLRTSPIGAELLDDVAADPTAVRHSLHNIARANRWFGGLAAVRWGLARLLPRAPARPVTLLDVGTGAGDVPAMARRWAARRGIGLRAIALERHPAAARIATGAGLPVVLGCGGTLPFRARSVDLVIASQVAHHLDREDCVALLRECDRVARLGVVLADLHRSRAAALGFWVGGRLLRFDRFTLADGVTSLQRGFTTDELRGLLARSGIRATVRRRPGARLVAVWEVAA
jgi:2-polyprenyl-3-methyl-5-hydroxy-6-metoxy-1,4-benzoquinol methylase